MTELWLPVPEEQFASFYIISNEGFLKSLDRTVQEKTGLKRFHKGKLITPKKTGLYLGVSLFNGFCSKRFYLHRLVAKAFIPNPYNKPFVNHINFNPHDNRVSNLEWVTAKENTKHSNNAGRIFVHSPAKGEYQHSAKLTSEIVKELRLFWMPGDSIKELSKKYKVSNRALYQMLSGKTWRHVNPFVAVNWPCKSEVRN